MCESVLSFQGDNQIWTGDKGVADPCLTTWLCRHISCLDETLYFSSKHDFNKAPRFRQEIFDKLKEKDTIILT